MHHSVNDRAGCAHLANLDTGQLNRLAIQGLGPMFSPEKQLFCHRLRKSQAGLVQEGLSPRYTLMTVLGLHRYECTGMKTPFDNAAILRGLVGDTSWITNIGDLGLLLWTCALVEPDSLSLIRSKIPLDRVFDSSREVREGRTMELAWLLSGLSHAALARPQEFQDLTDLTMKTYQLLKKNQGGQGIFGHLATKGTFFGILRGRIGSFADQVYPIYALSKFTEAYQVQPALEMAKNCAGTICRVQGTLGQWWWHYDAATGRVVERFPVYSVHQDGMAPLALFALGEASGMDFSEPIYKGLGWIAGNNELGVDMRDPSTGMIWRSIYHGDKHKARLGNVLGFLGAGDHEDAIDDLKVLPECRPYHLGWLLYAFAGR